MYGKFVKRGNSLWLLASVIPFSLGFLVNYGRQPTDDI
jgi:hypothetical protein